MRKIVRVNCNLFIKMYLMSHDDLPIVDDFCRALVIENGRTLQSFSFGVFWHGKFSIARKDGSLKRFVQNVSKELYERDKVSNIVVILMEDGNITSQMANWDARVKRWHDKSCRENKKFFLGTLAQVIQEPYHNFRYIYLPLDDDFFDNGVTASISKHHVPWEKKKSDLCWRGACSGYGGLESVRARFLRKIFEIKDSLKNNLNVDADNVRLTREHSRLRNYPREYFAEPANDTLDFKEFMKYKIFFIIDGNVIASSHMWGLAAGCVPFLISNARCWFSSFLVPYYHYVPVDYDLSDLYQKIEWVLEHDHEAKRIAENALAFADFVFSSQFQKHYLLSKFGAA